MNYRASRRDAEDTEGLLSVSSASLREAICFDSLDAQRGPRSFRFEGRRGVLRADRVEDVIGVMRGVEEAVARGLHAAGFVAYEAAPAFDAALATRAPDPRLPLAWFALFERRIETGAGEDEEAGDADAFALGGMAADEDEAEHARAVAAIREWIAAGDTYQVNHTFRLRAPFSGSPRALYRRLCEAQRAAFCAYLEVDDELAIVSASPELFFRQQGDEIELRPMKGTRPRGRWRGEDERIARELAASPKDRAENLMIVDLLRNDAGRIAEFGSVRVERLYEVEPYPTVHQMTSTIRARTRPGTTLTDVFRALFPCGSITGAPKVRTSRIIAELEKAPRGVYTGAIGFVSPGEAAFSVAIRTLVVDRARGEAELGVGSGVTYDSVAADEYRECLSKAAFVHRPPPPSLIETFGWTPEAGYVRLDAHLARMRESAAYFGHAFNEAALRRRLPALDLPPEPRRIRVLLTPRGEIEVEHTEMPRWREPVRLAVARRTVDASNPLWYHKTAERWIYASHDPVTADHDLVLLINERGELTETSIANVVVEIDGVRWTPPIDAGLLPGVPSPSV